ncbi:Tuberculostearic acid methyltransferase UfaA1 [Hydrogenovibrio crunogenus]|uniref:Tuberculostearic acid methyltransferase UfaA1 n=1 Tax=Hydrogenovibrio crunogenus TaxID=39765 RepID=A0A4P7P207_9GAMM|nr:cyclopropane-fatty-acyl-phospholipid synthase family protein [Hydrogenovibrio crunogenus]QBZ84193.1 Tuberculostearic acid methyltransferase UfaA1 [Hydrogenovibrio crunogenus]
MLKLITTPIEWMMPSHLLQKFIQTLPFKHIQKGSLTVQYLGQSYRFEGPLPGSHADLEILSILRFGYLLKTQGELGFAQAYIEHSIRTASLHQLMTLAHQNRAEFTQLLHHKKPLGIWHLWRHRRRHNSVSNSRRNIAAHYDLGNDFYELWLDDSMSYSSGLFLKKGESLEQAQQQKYQRILDQLPLHGQESVLEIGCGWGGFAEIATQKGIDYKGLTLSIEQQNYASNRLKALQLNNKADITLQDYRHETGQYDYIVSIEMFEAVGKEYWHRYFEQLQRNLKSHGKAVLQIITIDDEEAETYQNGVDFIQSYIFPGGLLPSLEQLHQLAIEHQFEIVDQFEFGQDYATTLSHWMKQFNASSETLEKMGYDASFQRLWRYYLDYCRVGFEQQHISVYQITLEKRF